MHKRQLLKITLWILCSLPLFAAGNKEHQDFPSKSLTIIVPYSEGGGTDTIARSIGASLEKILKQEVFIENKLGGSGAVGMISGAAAIPDGYTLTMVTRELVSLPAQGLAEITRDDFQLLGLVNKDSAVLVVAGDSSYESLDQIIENARKTPGKLRFASAAKPHFYILEFENHENIMFNKIPYNGAAKAIPAVSEGHADFTLANAGELKVWLNEGKVRALAIMADERAVSLPDVPTFKELGYDITSFTWRGLAVPLDTDKETLNILQDAVREACSDPSFIQTMSKELYSLDYMNAHIFSQFIEMDNKTITAILEKMASDEKSAE
ncbi:MULTISPECIES: tripartite tricarboxylate transporter substrate binding protein [unclassified Oceanispirochaeta]|uniref:tripartite tricarboxylate transporter substrate binding protein n=1 Tax=unclassified Oceanispirochaeta TaxID=2635722 RepID=UPI00131458C5|nr:MULTISPECIES: tripartite tricarboxylate transporter substrate binding protein [unclassified Oceanispirochaeta]MBF9016403.1 tripartite tricarboxylate transporter substrate binding protein [Oceanispirochaeta sp. M2]NPD72865.1 tripartite tricarboxylate transporter substrate binding protein [Oceanispirochaeta sp. M1]